MQPLMMGTKPSFHLASVVDDHLMRISHVIRGEDWINDLPKHVLIYLYLGFKIPRFVHLPLLSSPLGRKLSKRQNHPGLAGLIDIGLLPAAIKFYISSMINQSFAGVVIPKPRRLQINQNLLIKHNKCLLKTTKCFNINLLQNVDVARVIELSLQKATLITDVHRLGRCVYHTKPHG